MKAIIVVLALALAACAGAPPRPADLGVHALVPAADAAHKVALSSLLEATPYTIIVFFSAHCACQRAHDPRLVEIAKRYRPRGVQVVAVDSESGVTPAEDLREAEQRGYPFPIYEDPGGELARASGAEFATYTLLLDRNGNVLYRGGIDSDRSRLSPGASRYLENALDAVLARKAPPQRERPALGCTLRTD